MDFQAFSIKYAATAMKLPPQVDEEWISKKVTEAEANAINILHRVSEAREACIQAERHSRTRTQKLSGNIKISEVRPARRCLGALFKSKEPLSPSVKVRHRK